MKKMLRVFLVSCLSLSVLTFPPAVHAGSEASVRPQVWAGVTRVAGDDRYETAVLTSKKYFPTGSDVVLIATGEDWADALCASALAGAYDAPLLLVRTASLPDVVLDEIVRLAPEKAVLLGGEAAISANVASAVDGIPGVAIERIFGPSRYETAQAVVSRFRSVVGTEWSGQVFVATGTNFPDALGASAAAAGSLSPILLSRPDQLPASSLAAVRELAPRKVLILGGAGAIGPEPEATIMREGVDIARFAGSDRYDTCSQVVQYARETWGASVKSIGLSSGENFPDALGAGAALGHANRLQVLSNKTSLPAKSEALLVAVAGQTESVVVFGGETAVQQPVLDRTATVLNVAWSSMSEGYNLTAGQSLISSNGQYSLHMQTDGNLVLYYVTSSRALWSTNTQGNAAAYLRLQLDGNLVVYSSAGKALWNSGTAGVNNAHLDVQNDGNVVVYYDGGAKGLSGINTQLKKGEILYPGQYIHSSNSRYRLIMQTDGNLVLYDREASPVKALWNSATSGGDRAVMQTDGNFVVYQGSTPLWHSHTNGHPGSRVVVQADSNLVIYEGTAAIWDRHHGLNVGPVFPVNYDLSPNWFGLTYPNHEAGVGAFQYSAIDLNLPSDGDRGQSVYAIDDGVVHQDDANFVIIRHTRPLVLKNGTQISTWYSLYGHLSQSSSVTLGSTISRGQVIGTIGNLGADNYHLHFSIFRSPVNNTSYAISPYWLPGVYSSDPWVYADDQYGTRVDGGEPGLYQNRILSTAPSQ